MMIAGVLTANEQWDPKFYETKEDVEVLFHNFSWGTSLQDFTARMGNPAHVDEINGLRSLVYDNLMVSGYPVFMVAYFSANGLEGGTYYFNTFSFDELVKCYTEVQRELLDTYGWTNKTLTLFDEITRERRPYQTAWRLQSGYVHLNVNTRQNDPVSVWFSSPGLTRQLLGS
jgi:hypothetical protein